MSKDTRVWHLSPTTLPAYYPLHSFSYFIELTLSPPETLLIGRLLTARVSRISTTHPDALQAILAPKSPCIKPPFYDIDYPLSSLRMTRDPVLHDKRRKVWDQGLSIKALREYQARIITLANLLADQLGAFGGEAVNATRWFTYFGFDTMAAVAFNTSFNMMRDGKEHFAIKMLNVGLSQAAILAPVFWFVSIVLRSPLPSKLASFKNWCKQQSDLRRKVRNSRRIEI